MAEENKEKQDQAKEAETKDIVKEIFGKSSYRPKKTSTLFTHFRHPAKPLPKVKASLFMKKLPAAIDIGASSIKILQLAQRQPKGELEIVCIDQQGYSIRGKVPEIIDQREILKTLIERNEIGSEVIAGISASEVQIYNLIFPQMGEAELNEAIRLKITQLRPFGLDLGAITYGFIKGDNLVRTKSTQQKILLVCASRELIHNRIILLKDLGLRPLSIEVAPMTLANLDKFRLQSSGYQQFQAKGEIALWLNLGAQESTLTITQAGLLCFCRVLAINSTQMTKQIIQHTGISEEEAEAVKREYGFSYWSPDKKIAVFAEPEKSFKGAEDKSAEVYRSLVSSLENFVVDMTHSFKYFSYQVTQSRVTNFDLLLLSGGGAKLKNLDLFLKTRLGVPVEMVNPFSFFKVSPAISKEKADLLSNDLEFTVALALALGSRIDPNKRINLISQEQKKGLALLKEQLRDKLVMVAIILLATTLGLVVYQTGKVARAKWKLNAASGEVQLAQTQLNRLQSQQLKLAEEEAALLEKNLKLKERLVFLEGATRQPESFAKLLAEVANLLPEEVWVTRLVYLEDKITITGSTSNIQVVMELIETLKKSKSFIDVTFTYTQRDVDKVSDVYSFEVIVTMST
ncbi:MAG: pilus assembly protein PilM [Candidatus Omnitrophota bacterium]